jgi:hypothetical protein
MASRKPRSSSASWIPAGRRLGRLKRAAAELRIHKGARKPHPQLPGHAQNLQRRGVITVQIMIGKIALAAQTMEQLGHLTLKHAIALQPPQQLLLGFLLPQLHAEARRHLLGQRLPQLPQLQQRRIGVVRDIALRQGSQPEQLLVVGAQVHEVGASGSPSTGGISQRSVVRGLGGRRDAWVHHSPAQQSQ